MSETKHTQIDFEPGDEFGVVGRVERAQNGIKTACIEVSGTVEIEGVEYRYEKRVRARLKRAALSKVKQQEAGE